jgi:hypothetical protein
MANFSNSLHAAFIPHPLMDSLITFVTRFRFLPTFNTPLTFLLPPEGWTHKLIFATELFTFIPRLLETETPKPLQPNPLYRNRDPDHVLQQLNELTCMVGTLPPLNNVYLY